MKNDIEMAKMHTAGRIYFTIGLWGLIFIFIVSLFSGYGYYTMIFGTVIGFHLLGLSFSNGWAFIYTIACMILMIIGFDNKRKVKKYLKEHPVSQDKL